MNKVMMSLNFDYHKINALFIQKIIEKIGKCNILIYSRFVIIRFNSFKDWNEMNKVIKQWLIDKRKNIIVEIIVKYKSKSKKELFDLFEKIEFSSKILVSTSDNFDDESFFFSFDEVFFFSSFDKLFSKKKIKKSVKKKKRISKSITTKAK